MQWVNSLDWQLLIISLWWVGVKSLQTEISNPLEKKNFGPHPLHKGETVEPQYNDRPDNVLLPQ